MFEKLNMDMVMFVMILLIIIGFILMLIPLFKRNTQRKVSTVDNPGLTQEDLNKIDKSLNKEQLINDIFDIYKKVEVAKSKFKYDILKELLTDELYQEEESKLINLKKEKQKQVSTNIKLEEAKILSVKLNEENTFIDAYLYVSGYNYVVDNKKNIIRGTDTAIYQIEYKLTLEQDKDKHFKIKKQECIGKWIKNN